MAKRIAHGSAVNHHVQPVNRASMTQRLGGLIIVITADFSHAITPRAVWTEGQVAVPDPFADCPERAAGKAGSDFCLLGMFSQKDRNEPLIKSTPLVGQLPRQVLIMDETGGDTVGREAFRSVHALLTQHDPIVTLHYIKVLR